MADLNNSKLAADNTPDRKVFRNELKEDVASEEAIAAFQEDSFRHDRKDEKQETFYLDCGSIQR